MSAASFSVEPHGIILVHTWHEVGHLLRIIRQYGIDLVVEIGMLHGGLSQIFLEQVAYCPSLRYLGIEINAANLDARVKQLASRMSDRVQLLEVDALSAVAKQVVSLQLLCARRAFVYCDGGDKAKEARTYWPLIQPGDLLGLHDYSDDPREVGPEVFPEMVSDIISSGVRLDQERLAETRILLLQKK